MSEKARRDDLFWVAKPFLLAVLFFVLFHAVGRTYLGGYALSLGTFRLPEPRENVFWLCAAIFGLPASGFLAAGLARASTVFPRVKQALELAPESDDKIWIAFGTLAGFLVPFALRMLVLDDAPVADDESAYEFGARLVASGHLTSPSPPMKLFYDRAFMVNDGHLYPMYFMGWPILMAPGVWLGAAGYMNALYFGLTVPAIYLAGRELGGRAVARAATLLFVTSPMLAIAAATQMSNTTCFMALAWTFACWLRARREDAPLRWHAGLGIAFGLAALIRPVSALGVGGPVLVAWLFDVVRGPRAALPRRLLALAVPGAVALVIFLAINKVQNGSFTKLSYAREFQYAKENGLRFTHWGSIHWREQIESGKLDEPHFAARPFYASVGNAAAAVIRLGTATFGWVPSFAFAPFALRGMGTKGKDLPVSVLVAGVVAHFAIHFGVADLGIDTFGTHHYFEIALAIVLLSALGVHRIARWLAEHVTAGVAEDAGDRRSFPVVLVPGALLAGLTFFAVIGTTPPRVAALLDMARDANLPREMVAERKIKNAVVFAPQPFTTRMALCTQGARHFVYWRPNNDPALKNDVLWVNHVTVEEDRKLMAHFPQREAWIYFFDDSCAPQMVPLDAPGVDRIPPGNIDNLQLPPGMRRRASAPAPG